MEALDNRAGTGEAAEALERFVEEVAGVEIGSDENVGLAFDGAGGEFFGGNLGVDGGVELHFAVDEPVGVILSDLIDNEVDFF